MEVLRKKIVRRFFEAVWEVIELLIMGAFVALVAGRSRKFSSKIEKSFRTL